jgi:hypothetical protein
MSAQNVFSVSQVSLSSTGSNGEDWDHSMSQYDIRRDTGVYCSDSNQTMTPRNSIAFPAENIERTPRRGASSEGKRPLSELLNLHAQKGTDIRFTAEDASRLAEVLGQWVSVDWLPHIDHLTHSLCISTTRSPRTHHTDKFRTLSVRSRRRLLRACTR